MKKAAFILIGVLVALVVTIRLILPAVIDGEALMAEAGARIEQRTGRAVGIGGDVSLSLFPTPHVTVTKIAFANVPGASRSYMIYAPEMTIDISLFSVLTGDPSVSNITLHDPDIHLEVLRNGKASWQFDRAPAPEAEAGEGGAATGMSGLGVEALHLENATVHYLHQSTGLEQTVEGLDMAFSALSVTGPFRLELEGSLGGMSFEGKVSLGDLRAGEAPFQIILHQQENELLFQGKLAKLQSGDYGLSGAVKLDMPNAVPFIRAWIVEDAQRIAEQVQPATLIGQVDWDGTRFSFTRSKLAIAGIEGSIALDLVLDGSSQSRAAARFGTVNLDTFQSSTLTEKLWQLLGQMMEARAPEAVQARRAKPVPLRGVATVEAATIIRGGKAFTNLKSHFTFDEEGATLEQLSVDLPGGGAANFIGIISTGDDNGIGFNGKIEANGDNFREVIAAFGGELADIPENLLRKFSLKGEMAGNSGELRFNEIQFSVDELRSIGAVIISTRKKNRTLVRATMRVEELPFDIYVPELGKPREQDDPMEGETIRQAPAESGLYLLRKLPFDFAARISVGQIMLAGKKGEDIYGDFIWDGSMLKATGIKLRYAGVSATGEVDVSLMASRPYVDARLSFGDIDVADFMDGENKPSEDDSLQLSASGIDARWSRNRINFDWLHSLNGVAELRFSKITYNDFPFEKIRIKARLDSAVLEVTEMLCTFFEGQLSAAGQLNAGTVPVMSASYSINNLALRPFLELAAGIDTFTGRASAKGTLKTGGINQASIISNLGGDVSFIARPLIATGFDLTAISRRLSAVREVGDLLALGRVSLAGGTTEFEEVAGSAYIENGVIKTNGIKVESPITQARAVGYVSLTQWVIDAAINFKMKEYGDNVPPLGLRLVGSLDAPERKLDTRELEAFIARKAAEKLLEKIIK